MRTLEVGKGGRSAAPMKGPDLINSMFSDEALMEIMGRLDGDITDRNNCALVCKRWRRVEGASRASVGIGPTSVNTNYCMDRLLLRFTDLRRVHIYDEMLNHLALGVLSFTESNTVREITHMTTRIERERYRRLEALAPDNEDIDEDRDVELNKLMDRDLVLLGQGCPRLEKLCLSWCSGVTGSGIVSLGENCKFLKVLEIQGQSVNCGVLEAVGQSCTVLEDLTLEFIETVTREGLVTISNGCGKTLKTLCVSICDKVGDCVLTSIGGNFPSLERLTVKSYYIDNYGVLAIAEGCLRLKQLRLTFVLATEETLQALGNNFLSLETLALYKMYSFPEPYRSSVPMVNVCKKLKSITLRNCDFLTDPSLVDIANGCCELTVLKLFGCNSIVTTGLVAIGRCCRGLEVLALENCKRVENDGLIAIGQGCAQLQSLQLADLARIGYLAICNIALGCRNLWRLYICRCEKIGDTSIEAIAENCKKLTDLDLRFSTSIGNKALAAISHGCKSLKNLNVSYCHLIRDSGISVIANGCHQLNYLDISGCKISDSGLAFLAYSCRRLQVCKMPFCPLVSKVGVATVVAGCPGIKKIVVEQYKVSARTRRRAARVIELCTELY